MASLGALSTCFYALLNHLLLYVLERFLSYSYFRVLLFHFFRKIIVFICTASQQVSLSFKTSINVTSMCARLSRC